MRSKLTERLSELEQKIYQHAGHEFNVQSPKQLGVVLFEEMKYTPIKKTKTGYSTSVEVLEKMGDVPIVASILAYRQVAKIQSTYVEGLLRVIHGSDSKVHTRYLQTLTQTGRLSSVDPNLQNIPVRIEEGRQIRKAFVPSQADWQILSADYSQIELRVLAHITGDKNLQAAFINGEDIHAATARRIFALRTTNQWKVIFVAKQKPLILESCMVFLILGFQKILVYHVKKPKPSLKPILTNTRC